MKRRIFKREERVKVGPLEEKERSVKQNNRTLSSSSSLFVKLTNIVTFLYHYIYYITF